MGTGEVSSVGGVSTSFEHGGDAVELAMLRVALDAMMAQQQALLEAMLAVSPPGTGEHVNAYA